MKSMQQVVDAVREGNGRLFKDLGAKFVEIELPHEKYAVATYYIVAPCEASSNLSRYDGVRYTKRASSTDLNSMYTQTRQQYFGDEVIRRMLARNICVELRVLRSILRQCVQGSAADQTGFRQRFQTGRPDSRPNFTNDRFSNWSID